MARLPLLCAAYIEGPTEWKGMTSKSHTAPIVAHGAAAGRDRTRDRRLVRTWLYIVALLIVAMVVVGGATRMTGSGLSITEWKPIHGVIPPLNEAEWHEEFEKYRQIPQYQIVNAGMSLAEFQFIFWWEWAHRLLGRLIGAVVLLPLAYFWLTGRLENQLKPRMIGLFMLGGLQGFVGWWMVTSGLTERVEVSQYRLTVHLTLACILLAITVWVARSIAPRWNDVSSGLKRSTDIILGLVLFQIFLGGLVAGLNAGLIFNTWPLMDGGFVPGSYMQHDPWWLAPFESISTSQFNHRIGAYLLFALVLVHVWRAWNTPARRGAVILAVLVTLQAAIGIETLLRAVPLSLGLLHQLGAVIVLWAAVEHRRAMSRPLPVVS
jgi:cytochrome c oxidase assembly protein subunit 15